MKEMKIFGLNMMESLFHHIQATNAFNSTLSDYYFLEYLSVHQVQFSSKTFEEILIFISNQKHMRILSLQIKSRSLDPDEITQKLYNFLKNLKKLETLHLYINKENKPAFYLHDYKQFGFLFEKLESLKELKLSFIGEAFIMNGFTFPSILQNIPSLETLELLISSPNVSKKAWTSLAVYLNTINTKKCNIITENITQFILQMGKYYQGNKSLVSLKLTQCGPWDFNQYLSFLEDDFFSYREFFQSLNFNCLKELELALNFPKCCGKINTFERNSCDLAQIKQFSDIMSQNLPQLNSFSCETNCGVFIKHLVSWLQKQKNLHKLSIDQIEKHSAICSDPFELDQSLFLQLEPLSKTLVSLLIWFGSSMNISQKCVLPFKYLTFALFDLNNFDKIMELINFKRGRLLKIAWVLNNMKLSGLSSMKRKLIRQEILNLFI